MKHFLLWKGLMSQTKFSYLTHHNGAGGYSVLEISIPTSGASGYLQYHLNSERKGGEGEVVGGLCLDPIIC